MPRPRPAGCAPDGGEPAWTPPRRRTGTAGVGAGPLPRPLPAFHAADPGLGDGRCGRRRPANQHGRPQRLPGPAHGQTAVPHRGCPAAGRAAGAPAGGPLRRHVQPDAAHHRHQYLQLGAGRGPGSGRGRGPPPWRRPGGRLRHGRNDPRPGFGARRCLRDGGDPHHTRRAGVAARGQHRVNRSGRIVHRVDHASPVTRQHGRFWAGDRGAGQRRSGARTGRIRTGWH